MSNLTDLISAGGGATLETIMITTSQTWTPPVNGTGVIHVIGGGRSGSCGDGTGGSAAGYCRKAITFATGTNWTFVVGAGGINTGGGNGYQAGGNSTATDGSSSMTAYGPTSNSYNGGSASGGDVNYTGGTGNSGDKGGAGAVSILSNSSGNAVYNSGGQTCDVYAGGFYLLGLGQITGGKGGRGGGRYGGNGGMFSGGGSGINYTGGVFTVGGDGGIGAGGGAAPASSTAYQNPGNGGDGIIIIQYLTVS